MTNDLSNVQFGIERIGNKNIINYFEEYKVKNIKYFSCFDKNQI